MLTCLTLFNSNTVLSAFNNYYAMDIQHNDVDDADGNPFYKQFIDETNTRINAFVDNITVKQMQTQQAEDTEFGNDLHNVETLLAQIERYFQEGNNIGADYLTHDVTNGINVLAQKLHTRHNKNVQILTQLNINNAIKSNATRIFLAELEMYSANERRYIAILNALTKKLKRFEEAVGSVCIQYADLKNHEDVNYTRLLQLHTNLENLTKTNYPDLKKAMFVLLTQLEKHKNYLRRTIEHNI